MNQRKRARTGIPWSISWPPPAPPVSRRVGAVAARQAARGLKVDIRHRHQAVAAAVPEGAGAAAPLQAGSDDAYPHRAWVLLAAHAGFSCARSRSWISTFMDVSPCV